MVVDKLHKVAKRNIGKARKVWNRVAGKSEPKTELKGSVYHVRLREPKLKQEKPKKSLAKSAKKSKASKKSTKKPAKKSTTRTKKKSVDYSSMTKKEIYEIAQDLDIDGRSTMTKKELIKAVKKAK